MNRLLVALLLVATPALAAEKKPRRTWADESPQIANAGFALSGIFFKDPNIQAAYGTQGRFLTTVQVGLVPWSRYVHLETNLTFGFSQFKGAQVFVDGGSASADTTMMTLFPLGGDLLVGLDLVPEQPVVPYGGVGFQLMPWRENALETGEQWSGVRFGGAVFFGGAVLLDALEPRRASRLDASTGINDVYLTFEGRFRKVDAAMIGGVLNTSGLDFSGWTASGGLKFVF